jgi:hypothetical protein
MKSSRRAIVALVLCAMTGSAFGDEAANRSDQVSLKELITSNQSKTAQLALGMSKAEVMALMGNKTAKTGDGVVNNPWLVEARLGSDGAQYEVLYYLTSKNPPFTPIRQSLTTPIVIKDGKVIAWGSGSGSPIGGSGGEPPVQGAPVSSYVTPQGANSQGAGGQGVTVYPADACIGAIVNGVCHGTIQSTDPMPKVCHGEMIGGRCTGPMF